MLTIGMMSPRIHAANRSRLQAYTESHARLEEPQWWRRSRVLGIRQVKMFGRL